MCSAKRMSYFCINYELRYCDEKNTNRNAINRLNIKTRDPVWKCSKHYSSNYCSKILMLCYADRLKNLGLMSLENRRIRSDLIETYKIINGYYN